MADNSELIRLTDRYKTARTTLRRKQKAALENLLWAEKYELGKALEEARHKRGLSIAELGTIIGIKNRSFLYDMINTYRNADTPEQEKDTDTMQADTETVKVEQHKGYELTFLEDTDSVLVRFDEDEEYELVRIEGTNNVEVPEEWADHTKERRAIYKIILTEIRNHFKG